MTNGVSYIKIWGPSFLIKETTNTNTLRKLNIVYLEHREQRVMIGNGVREFGRDQVMRLCSRTWQDVWDFTEVQWKANEVF